MGRARGPEAIRAVVKLLLVDCLQHHRHRALEDLVLERRDADGPRSRSITLRDVDASNRRREVRARLEAVEQAAEILVESLRVRCRRLSVHSGGPILAGPPVRFAKKLDVDVVGERGEHHLRISSRQLCYPLQSRGDVQGTRSSRHLALQWFRVPARPVPPPGPVGLVPRLRRYNEELRLPVARSRPRFVSFARWLPSSCSCSLPSRASTARVDLDPIIGGPPESSTETQDLPGSCRTSRVYPLRSLTPAGPRRSGQTARVGAASAIPNDGRSQQERNFRGSITGQLHSLCTLRSAGCPTTTQHSVPGGGHLSRAAVDPLQGSFERFQFFVRPPLPGLAWRTRWDLSAGPRRVRVRARRAGAGPLPARLHRPYQRFVQSAGVTLACLVSAVQAWGIGRAHTNTAGRQPPG